MSIEIDNDVLEQVRVTYGLRTKRDTVDFARRRLLIVPVASPMTKEEALAMQGRGWAGDLDEMRRGSGPRS